METVEQVERVKPGTWALAPPYGYPLNASSQAPVNSIVIAGGRGHLFGFWGYNRNAVAQFLLLFDSDTLPADGAIPAAVLKVAGSSNFSAFFGSIGRAFDRGIVICNSSTDTTKTIGAADLIIDVQYGH